MRLTVGQYSDGRVIFRKSILFENFFLRIINYVRTELSRKRDNLEINKHFGKNYFETAI